MATVEFPSEKDQEQGLRRNKNFIGMFLNVADFDVYFYIV